MQSLIIIGTQRSGSNLLRLMLNQLDEIQAPHPPHILSTFFPLLPGYCNLYGKENFKLLLDDVCAFIRTNPVPWEIKDLTTDNLEKRCKGNTLVHVYLAVYEMYAAQKGATIWCSKSMANLYYIPEIENQGLKPVYLHLIRDGRDVAASFRKAIVGEKHPYNLALQWKTDQETAEKHCLALAPERYVPVWYENLIHDTENTLRILLHHLGLQFNKKMLDYYNTEEAIHTAEAGKMWNNVCKPVMEKNSNKFLSQLSDEDILTFESIAGDTLQHFGYTPYFAKDKWTKSFSESEIATFTKANKEQKQKALLLDPDGIEKRKAQEAVVTAIKARQG